MTLAAGRYMFGLIFLGLAIMIFTLVWRAIRKGELPSRGTRQTSRWDQPFAFWLGVANYLVIASWLSLSALALCGVAPHWFLHLRSTMHH